MFKNLILLFAFIFWGSGVIAQTFYCKVKEYGYQHGAAASGMTLKEIEFWIPAEFELNSKIQIFELQFLHSLALSIVQYIPD